MPWWILLLPEVSCLHQSVGRMSSSLWFESLFGFNELDFRFNEIQNKFQLIPTDNKIRLVSKINQRSFDVGNFSCRSVRDLREEAKHYLSLRRYPERAQVTVSHDIIEDSLPLHHRYPGSVIQAASQFNCLEFPDSLVTPEEGVTEYVNDPTQGPACAIACAAGTVYRNYFVPVNGRIGQTVDNQINNLDEAESLLGDTKLWEIRNGYSFSTETKLNELNAILKMRSDELLDSIKVGVHKDVGVVFRERYIEVSPEEASTVTQVYASALSCAYSGIPAHYWECFARLVLNACYEATLWTAVINSLEPKDSCKSYPHDVFLTFLGGGVFGNDMRWIVDAICRAIKIIQSTQGVTLNIHICHYRRLKSDVVSLINEKLTILE